MWKPGVVGVLVTAGLLVCPMATSARLIEDWPYDKLLKHADLVVFATAVKTEAADDEPPAHSWNYEFVAQATTFKVTHVLKGKVEDKQFEVLHFKFGDLKKGIDPNDFVNLIIMDGPLLVAFRTGPVIVKARGEEQNTVLPPPEYLLFLKRMEDGRYEPVSGRIDPALSVKEVSAPLDRVLGGGK